MPLREPKYKYNQSILKLYDDGVKNKKIKVIHMSVLRTAGIEDDSPLTYERGMVNSGKINESIIRTKNKIFELAFCNPWEWFFTGTLNSEYDRENLEEYHKTLTKWISNYNRLKNTEIKYLLIPELHKDGKSWHMHGFIMGLPVEHMKQFKIGDKMGRAVAAKVKNGEDVYNWLGYADKFGFCSLEPIRNHEAVSKYITKYINKELESSVTALNAHKYYRSRNLREAETIEKGVLSLEIKPTYEGEYCSVAWLDYSDEVFNEIKGAFLKNKKKMMK
ncbi:MAG: hypothetical protein FWC41_12760 [Firmicutes bacterium]|nr:hypothetical protein [Bacillota bacterium]